MKATLRTDCKVKVIAWDNESVLTAPDWNVCYDVAYDRLGMHPPLAGDPSRGKHYKKMLSVPIASEIGRRLTTFVKGDEEVNYLQSYTSAHISVEEFWPIVCEHGFRLDATDRNVKAIRTAQMYLLKSRDGEVRVVPEVVELLFAVASILPQYMLSNTNPEIYEGFKDADYMKAIPEENRFLSIFTGCRKPAAKAYEGLIDGTGFAPQEILFIDDKDSNIEAARNNGIEGIVFNGQKQSERALIHQLEGFGILISG